MMYYVASHYVSQGSNRYSLFTGGAHAARAFVGDVFQQMKVGAPLQVEFIQEIGKAAIISVRVFDIAVLFKTLDWSFVTARNSQYSIRKYPLPVDEMAEDFLRRPFSIRVGKGAFFLRHIRKHLPHLGDLIVQDG